MLLASGHMMEVDLRKDKKPGHPLLNPVASCQAGLQEGRMGLLKGERNNLPG